MWTSIQVVEPAGGYLSDTSLARSRSRDPKCNYFGAPESQDDISLPGSHRQQSWALRASDFSLMSSWNLSDNMSDKQAGHPQETVEAERQQTYRVDSSSKGLQDVFGAGRPFTVNPIFEDAAPSLLPALYRSPQQRTPVRCLLRSPTLCSSSGGSVVGSLRQRYGSMSPTVAPRFDISGAARPSADMIPEGRPDALLREGSTTGSAPSSWRSPWVTPQRPTSSSSLRWSPPSKGSAVCDDSDMADHATSPQDETPGCAMESPSSPTDVEAASDDSTVAPISNDQFNIQGTAGQSARAPTRRARRCQQRRAERDATAAAIAAATAFEDGSEWRSVRGNSSSAKRPDRKVHFAGDDVTRGENNNVSWADILRPDPSESNENCLSESCHLDLPMPRPHKKAFRGRAAPTRPKRKTWVAPGTPNFTALGSDPDDSLALRRAEGPQDANLDLGEYVRRTGDAFPPRKPVPQQAGTRTKRRPAASSSRPKRIARETGKASLADKSEADDHLSQVQDIILLQGTTLQQDAVLRQSDGGNRDSKKAAELQSDHVHQDQQQSKVQQQLSAASAPLPQLRQDEAAAQLALATPVSASTSKLHRRTRYPAGRLSAQPAHATGLQAVTPDQMSFDTFSFDTPARTPRQRRGGSTSAQECDENTSPQGSFTFSQRSSPLQRGYRRSPSHKPRVALNSVVRVPSFATLPLADSATPPCNPVAPRATRAPPLEFQGTAHAPKALSATGTTTLNFSMLQNRTNRPSSNRSNSRSKNHNSFHPTRSNSLRTTQFENSKGLKSMMQRLLPQTRPPPFKKVRQGSPSDTSHSDFGTPIAVRQSGSQSEPNELQGNIVTDETETTSPHKKSPLAMWHAIRGKAPSH